MNIFSIWQSDVAADAFVSKESHIQVETICMGSVSTRKALSRVRKYVFQFAFLSCKAILAYTVDLGFVVGRQFLCLMKNA